EARRRGLAPPLGRLHVAPVDVGCQPCFLPNPRAGTLCHEELRHRDGKPVRSALRRARLAHGGGAPGCVGSLVSRDHGPRSCPGHLGLARHEGETGFGNGERLRVPVPRSLPLATLVALLGRAHRGPARIDSPEALVQGVRDRFATGSAEAFDSLYSDPAGRAVVRGAIAAKAVRRGDLAAVLVRRPHSAIVLLAGTVLSGSSEDEANRTRAFSGLYRAADSAGGWRLDAKLPIDDENAIRAQQLEVRVTPGRGIEVTDRLSIVVGNDAGFVARLNGRARLTTVRLDGRPVRHLFGGNLLWIAAPRRRQATVTL